MIKELLQIRVKQFLREVMLLGIFRTVFLMILFSFIIIAILKYTSQTPHIYFTAIIYLFIIMSIHHRRKDLNFLKTQIDFYKRILFVEYTILIIPLIMGLLYNQYYGIIGFILIVIVLISATESTLSLKISNRKFLRWIPDHCFEWKAGIRNFFFWVTLIWIMGLATSFNMGAVPVAVFILGLIPLGFYEYGEPLPMILAYERNANNFLLYKIQMHIKLFSLLSFPLLFSFMAFHSDKWYIPVIEYVILLSVHLYIILIKYAFYEPNRKSRGSQTFGLIGIMGIFFFFLLPVVWVLSVYFYFKSKKNLKPYLYDYY